MEGREKEREGLLPFIAWYGDPPREKEKRRENSIA